MSHFIPDFAVLCLAEVLCLGLVWGPQTEGGRREEGGGGAMAGAIPSGTDNAGGAPGEGVAQVIEELS